MLLVAGVSSLSGAAYWSKRHPVVRDRLSARAHKCLRLAQKVAECATDKLLLAVLTGGKKSPSDEGAADVTPSEIRRSAAFESSHAESTADRPAKPSNWRILASTAVLRRVVVIAALVTCQ